MMAGGTPISGNLHMDVHRILQEIALSLPKPYSNMNIAQHGSLENHTCVIGPRITVSPCGTLALESAGWYRMI